MPQSNRSRVAWVCAASLCYYAAVTIGNTVAQSIFVARLGAGALPNVFLIKAGIDVVSALCYLPLTRNRNPRSVWGLVILFYSGTVVVGWWAVAGNLQGTTGAYVLYAGHEVAWTLAVIHWGIFLLHVLDPLESRRLFPVLFGMGRLGALVGGAVVGSLALSLGASNLLAFAVGLALVSGLASTRLRHSPTTRSETPEAPERRDTWARAFASPLVRLIALSTATMVVLRYGLRMVSLGEIRAAFENDKDQVAAFLGLFSVAANGIALVLGVWVVPRLLARAGVGAANLLYATTTLLAFVASWLAPSLATASAARFVEMPLKHALKTPLSVLFYGAERPALRIAARSLIFGAAIPLAAVVSGLGLGQLRDRLELISAGGIALAALYLGICAWQNHRYRERLAHLLQHELGVAAGNVEDLRSLEAEIQRAAPRLEARLCTLAARGLASASETHRSLAMVMLSERLSHGALQDIERLLTARQDPAQKTEK